MGKPTYNFGKNNKEKARQQKQMEKTSKRLIAKQNKANLKLNTPNEKSDTLEPNSVDDIAKSLLSNLDKREKENSMEVRYKKKWLGRSIGDIVKVKNDYANSLFLRNIAEKMEPLNSEAIKEKLERMVANKVKRRCRKS